jgi:hypothetical protein
MSTPPLSHRSLKSFNSNKKPGVLNVNKYHLMNSLSRVSERNELTQTMNQQSNEASKCDLMSMKQSSGQCLKI